MDFSSGRSPGRQCTSAKVTAVALSYKHTVNEEIKDREIHIACLLYNEFGHLICLSSLTFSIWN